MYGVTALQWAVRKGYKEIVNYLLKDGTTDLNIQARLPDDRTLCGQLSALIELVSSAKNFFFAGTLQTIFRVKLVRTYIN